MKLILASNSPRRKELLKQYGFDFEVIKSDYKEEIPSKTRIRNVTKILAYNKAKNVFIGLKNNYNAIVLGADTIVVYKNKILGKPKDKFDAENTLKMLSGKKHYVYTGYSIITNSKTITKVEKSTVYFNKLSEKLIKEYVETGLPLDKAGSYGIQDGYNLVKKYKGSYENIVGLPIKKVSLILKNAMK